MTRVLIAALIYLALGATVHGDDDLVDQLSAREGMMLKVEQTNPHCDFQRIFGPICNMTGFDGILTIEPDPSLTNVLEVSITGADTIILYPTCVPWVKFIGVQNFLTSLHKAPGTLKTDENCRTWLRAYNSKITSLRSAIHDLSLTNSTAETINLKDLRDFRCIYSNISVIEHLDWKGYRGEIANSNINNVLQMECRDNITINNSWIGKIGFRGFYFSAKLMVMNNTVIDEVDFRGMVMYGGIVTLENTIIRRVKRGGLIFSPLVDLFARNVTIVECARPCIEIPLGFNKQYLESLDITINGTAIANDLASVRTILEGEVAAVALQENDPHCLTLGDVLACDFNNSNEQVLLRRYSRTASRVNITKAGNLLIVADSNMDIVVQDSVGIYTVMPKLDKDPPEGNVTLTTLDTSLSVVHARQLRRLSATRSNLAGIKAGTVHTLVSEDSQLQILKMFVSKSADFSNSTLDVLNLTIDGALHAQRTHFENVSNLYISGEAEIHDSWFGYLDIHSITVSGSLLISHVTIEEHGYLPIYLTKSGKITLNQVTLETRYHLISAVRKDQVTWEERTAEELEDLVALRTPSDEGGTALADAGEPNCTEGPQRNTSVVSLPDALTQYIFCNYTGVEDAETVLVSQKTNIGDLYRSVSVLGAKYVRLANICSHTIRLINVTNATMDYVPHHCNYELFLQSSGVKNIVNEPFFVRIQGSSVAEMETPFTMLKLDIFDSMVGSLVSSPVHTHITRSNITSISMLHCHSSLIVNQSNIHSITSIRVGSRGILSNVKIDSINFPGIHSEGHSTIENATIRLLDRHSLTLGADGLLSMKNVVIEEGWIDSFNLSSGSISLINVTLMGSLLNNSIKLEHLGSATTTTIVPSSTVKVPTTSNIITTKPPGKPTNLTTDKLKATTAAVKSATSSGASAATQTQPWVKWATAGASIFLALVVVLVALSLVVVIRTHRSGETFSSRIRRIFRAANDDEHQLSTELDIHLAADRDAYTTHYTRLPSL